MKKFLITITVLILSAPYQLACTREDPELYPLKDRKPRVSAEGFSFVPPAGSDWLEQFGEQTILFFNRS